MTFDGLSLSVLVTELHSKLAGGRIDKIFQPTKFMIIIGIRQIGESHRLVISIDPEHPCLYIPTSSFENPAVPPTFCMVLRKHIEDGRIAGISQHGLDRIVKIDIDVRGEGGTIVTKTIMIELMGKHSNAILIRDGAVIDSIKRVGLDTSRVRQVTPGRPYVLPPAQNKLNILTTPPQEFMEHMHHKFSGSVAKSIINCGMGIGPVTAKEILWRSGLPADILPEHLDSADFSAMADSIETITRPLKDGIIRPTVVTDPANRLLGMAAFPLEHLAQLGTHNFATMSQAVEFARNTTGKIELPDQVILKKQVTHEIARLTRKLTALTEELSEANSAEHLRKCADILMANLYIENKNSSTITLPDFYSTDPQQQIEIPIDPELTLLENAQSYYTRYNKMKRAQNSLTDQLSCCKQDIDYLNSIELSLEQATTAAEFAEIRDELTHNGYITTTAKRRSSVPVSRPLKVSAPDGTAIYIGKNNYQNDEVTFKIGQNNDLWFHTKDIPGSHIILRNETGTPTEDTILFTAQLAAYHSKARDSAKIPVDFTQRKFVKKPAGAKPGFVIYTHQKTIFVTPNIHEIEQLIKNKE